MRGTIIQLSRMEACKRAASFIYTQFQNKFGEWKYVHYRNGSYEQDKTQYPNGPTGLYGGTDPTGAGFHWRFGDRTPVMDCVALGMHAAGADRKTVTGQHINQRVLIADAAGPQKLCVQVTTPKPGDLLLNTDHMGVFIRREDGTMGFVQWVMVDCSPRHGEDHAVSFRTVRPGDPLSSGYIAVKPLWQKGSDWK